MVKFHQIICFFLILSISIQWSCLTKNERFANIKPAPKGDVFYGGVFKYNETEFYRSLYPLNVTEVVGHRIVTQLYEGLVKFNQENLSIRPLLAKRWTVENNATIFTFTIRKGVFFHDDPCFKDGNGREMTIQDIVFSLQRLCTYDANNQGYWSVQGLIKGCDDYYSSTKINFLTKQLSNASDSTKIKLSRDIEESKIKLTNGISEQIEGVKILNDSTLQITLNKPFAGFLNRMALPFAAVFPKEAWEQYGVNMRDHAVGTGPFYLKTSETDVAVIMRKNLKYWGQDQYGNKLPYLEGIKISFIAEEKTELIEFTAGNFDLKYRIPLEMIDEVMNSKGNLKKNFSKYQLQNGQELSIQYYGFLHTGKIFNNINLRKAFNYAIDRQKICDFTLKGQGVPATNGIVPRGFPMFNYNTIQGYEFNTAKAKEFLSKAGYPNGNGLPRITLQINSGGGRNEAVAEAIQKMLEENLNVHVAITQMVWAQHTENLETSKSDFYRLGWVADYPDPENFLNLLYSIHVPKLPQEKAYINSFRYKSPVYDQLFLKANQTIDEKERYKLYEMLDQQVVNDAVVMPIYCPKIYRLLGANVRNFPINSMEFRDFETVYFEK